MKRRIVMRRMYEMSRTNSSCAISRRGLSILAVLAVAIIASLAGGLRERPAQAASPQATPTPTPKEPDYSNVDDILNGRRHLLRTDDLAVTSSNGDFYLTTADSLVTNIVFINALGASAVIRNGRLFNLPYDVPVRPF
jgi:hypothetical protein